MPSAALQYILESHCTMSSCVAQAAMQIRNQQGGVEMCAELFHNKTIYHKFIVLSGCNVAVLLLQVCSLIKTYFFG